jgi:hypothetical protein
VQKRLWKFLEAVGLPERTRVDVFTSAGIGGHLAQDVAATAVRLPASRICSLTYLAAA